MSIDPERLSAFQSRMNAWVSSQGLFFQLTHGGSVQGAKSGFMGGLSRLMLRLALLLMLLGVVFWIFMARRVSFGWFRDQLGERISLSLGADSAEVGGLGRVRGQLVIAKMVLKGGEESFFEDAQMWGVRTKMGLTDGILTSWDGGRVIIKELRTNVKSGADSPEEAGLAYKSLFHTPERFRFSGFDVEDATVTWGYSEGNRGAIRNARLLATKVGSDAWKMVFTGGQFSQNWLQRLEIDRIEMSVTPDGIVFEEMTLKLGKGDINMRVEFVEGGARPRLQGAGTIRGMPVANLVDPEFREFIGGKFSGTFTVQGSTNSQEGIGMEVQVKLEEGDQIELRDRFKLFGAISTADRFRSYKKVRFTTGQFTFRTGGGVMELSDAWLLAKDLMRLEGGFLVRPQTKEEKENSLGLRDTPETVGGQSMPRPGEDADDMTLGKAGKASKSAKEKEKAKQARRGLPGVIGQLANEAMVREERPFLEGKVRLGLIKEVFDRSPALDELYPVDPQDGVRWMEVPINGTIDTVGVPQAEELLPSRRLEGER